MKKLALLFVLALACSALAGNMELTSARLYKKQGEWLKAYQYFNESLRKDSLNLETYFERGELFKIFAADTDKKDIVKQILPSSTNPQVELYDKMMADFQMAVKAHKPDDEKIIKDLRKKMDKILQERWNYFYFNAVQRDTLYAEAVKKNVTDPDPKALLHEAIADLDMATKLIPDKWNTYGLKAQMYGKLGERKAAADEWKLAWARIASSEMPQKEPEQYKQAIEVIWGNLLDINYNLERYHEAISVADTILGKEPNNADALQYKAFSLARLASDTALTGAQRDDMKNKAVAALELARKNRPNDSVILYYIGQFQLQLGDTAKSLETFQNLLKVDSTDREVMFAMGVIYLEGGSYINTEKARDTFAKIVTQYPDHAPSWINYGIALIRLNDNKKGKEAIEKGKALGAGK